MANLHRRRLHDQVTKHLGVAILNGTLMDADRKIWSEADLSRSLGVSRSILRESVKVLESKGLIQARPNVGISLRPRSAWNLLDPDLLTWQCELGVDDRFISDLCEVRLAIETAAAGLAAMRGTEEEKRAVHESYEQMQLHIEDKARHDEADIAFHTAVFTASHNRFLQKMGTTIRVALEVQNYTGAEADLVESTRFHLAVSEAICQGDAAAARTAMERLILHVAEVFHGVVHPDEPGGWRREIGVDVAKSDLNLIGPT
jgi:GntR family galactonate operon transcriptional repressor